MRHPCAGPLADGHPVTAGIIHPMSLTSTSASPLRPALFAQLGGALIVFALAYLLPVTWLRQPLILAVLQGLCASGISWKLDAPRWWCLIHLLFMPLVVIALALQIAPGWYLAAFVLTLLIFWRTDKSRVPLYLSNQATAMAVADLLPTNANVIDIGCGDGHLLRRLALTRPDCLFTGIEHAPATWLVARLLNMGRRNVTIRYGDFWQHSLSGYDTVYAFLSPAPMPALWDKVQAELGSGKRLISNSFPVPDAPADPVIEVDDPRQTQLYCYTIGLKTIAKPQN